MMDKPENRARLRRKLELWPEGRGNAVNVNQGLELLDMVERLEKEADWLADELCRHCHNCHLRKHCLVAGKIENWRDAARKAISEEQCKNN